MRLPADENLPLPGIRLLRQAGIDVEAVAEFAAGRQTYRCFPMQGSKGRSW
jgi:hypothetical protein